MRASPLVLSAACALTAVLALGGCGAGSSSRSSNGAAAPANRGDVANGGAAAPQAPAGGGKSGAPIAAPNAGRAVVYTADLQVRTSRVFSVADHAKQIVTAVNGYTATDTEAGNPDSAQITFKVPSAQYATVLNQLGQLGTKVSLHQNSQDVTGQVADVASRVKSAQATLDTYRKFLDKAGSISEILDIEQQISGREADLESLQAQQKALADQTTYGTINLDLETPAAPAPKPPHHARGGGFGAGLAAGWAAFTVILWALVTLLGWLLPFLVVAAAIGLPILTVRRRAAARKPEAPAEEQPAEEPAEINAAPAGTPD